MTDRIICIHPEDPSTDFLLPISRHLYELFGDRVTVSRIAPDEEEHQKVLYDITKHDIVVFLGHGSSIGFHGARDIETNEFYDFLSKQEIGRFHSKVFLALSCNSADFFNKFSANAMVTSYLGFGDIPTEEDRFEISDDPEINMQGLSVYKEVLIEAMCYGLSSLKKTQQIRPIYERIIHYINQKMVELVINNPNDMNRNIADKLWELKSEIVYKG